MKNGSFFELGVHEEPLWFVLQPEAMTMAMVYAATYGQGSFFLQFR